ncbi:hypothetical protein F5Y04DRAFT_245003, partial [Hypomontagnella monticulosa]
MKPRLSSTRLSLRRSFPMPLQCGQPRPHRLMNSSTSRSQPSFGDSNYFPAGWNRERLLTASMADLRTLSADEFDKMRTGMIDKMGAEAFQHWVSLLPSSASTANMDSPQTRTGPEKENGAIPQSPAVPDFVRTVQERYATGIWGFVMFRSAGYDMSQEAWEEQRKRVEEAIRAPFEQYRDVDGVKDARERFHLEWVQDRAFEGDVELVARRYGVDLGQDAFPEGLRHPSFCLNVTPQALGSLEKCEQFGGDLQPFIQIVSPISTDEEYEENERLLAEEQDELYPMRFNVALGSLLDGLFAIMGRQSLSLGELGGHLRDSDVWTSIT